MVTLTTLYLLTFTQQSILHRKMVDSVTICLWTLLRELWNCTPIKKEEIIFTDRTGHLAERMYIGNCCPNYIWLSSNSTIKSLKLKHLLVILFGYWNDYIWFSHFHEAKYEKTSWSETPVSHITWTGNLVDAIATRQRPNKPIQSKVGAPTNRRCCHQ